METIEKIDILKIKSDIKEMVELQKFYKNQRKTVKLVGERKMDSGTASYKHYTNREELRMMYAAYGIARGKELYQIESRYDRHNVHPLTYPYAQNRIESILTKYKVLVKVESDENRAIA
jgi:hypothetical protein